MADNFHSENYLTKDDKTIDILVKALHGANETIDRQYSTILHLEQQIMEYESMNRCRKL